MKKITLSIITILYLLSFPSSSFSASRCGNKGRLKKAGRLIRLNPKKAISVYRAALKKCPGTKSLAYNLGLALYAAGNTNKAIRQFEKIIAKDKKAKKAVSTLAGILIHKQINIKKGIKLAEKGMKSGKTPALMDTLGWGYYLEGEMKKAKKWLKAALKAADSEHAKIIKQHLETAQNPKHLPDLSASFTYLAKHSGTYLEAGEKAELAIDIENKGKGTAYDVEVLLSQDNTNVLLEKKSSRQAVSYTLGDIRSQKKKTVKVNIAARPIAEDGFSAIRIKTKEQYGNNARDIVVKLPVRHIEKPSLAFMDIRYREDGIGRSKGNGNSIIENNETIEITVPVKNNGRGAARRVTLTIINSPSDIPITPKKIGLRNIMPGQTAAGKFALSLPLKRNNNKIPLTWKVTEGRGLSQKEKKETLDYRQREPELTFTHRFEDKGNENGVIEKGEQAALIITPENRGNYKAESVALRVNTKKQGIALFGRKFFTGNIPAGKKAEEIIIDFQVKRIFSAGSLPFTVTLTQADFSDFKKEIVTSVKEDNEEIIVFEDTISRLGTDKRMSVISSPPVIIIASPEDNQVTAKKTITVEGRAVDDKRVKRLEIRVNGRLLPPAGRKKSIAVNAPNRKKAVSQKKWYFKEKVRLATGENSITITAFDNTGLKETKTVTVKRLSASREVYVAVIGIDTYEDQAISKLRYARQDAASFRKHIKERLGVKEKNIFTLYNEKATRVNMLKVLGKKLRRAGPEDTVIIYYSGHGAPEPSADSPDGDGLEKYILPHDTDADDLFSSAISMDTISKIFRRIEAGWVVFIADSCYSGASGGRTMTASLKAPINDGFLNRLSEGKGRIILTASSANEVSVEGAEYGGGHGVFTHYLLKGLKGAGDINGDRKVDIEEIYSYVRKKVRRATNSRQTPVKKGESEGVLYLGKVEER